ncbi:MAG TPA: Hsp20/alpha crystallin family protein [Isosphaeraceae bacterium]|nr:Hsp20/alpha crystallin family protein [Isosphaeraceae bacterium]
MANEHWAGPFRDVVSLREAMNSLFQDSFVRPGGTVSGGHAGFPIDVAETDNEFIVQAALPGVKPDDVQITVHGETVSIRGHSKAEEEQKGKNWLLRERAHGTFQRSLALTAPIDSNKAVARFDHGILTLTLPKAEQAKPRQIKVSS